jgi:ribosomal 30S subunit maturation factor RimM
MIGDEVSDADRRTGVVTHLVSAGAEDVELVIEWMTEQQEFTISQLMLP